MGLLGLGFRLDIFLIQCLDALLLERNIKDVNEGSCSSDAAIRDVSSNSVDSAEALIPDELHNFGLPVRTLSATKFSSS